MKINLLHTDVDHAARRATMLVAIGFAFVVGTLATIGAGASYRSATRGTSVLGEVGNFFVFSEMRRIMWGTSADASNDPLATPDDRLNILLLGIGGEGHDGSQLTDTIIVASFDKQTKRLGLVSIPRDLAYPLGGGRFQKINAVNANFEVEHPGQGAQLTAEAFSKQFNLRIDRVLRIDFKGFEDFIDALGGVDVLIENTFIDRLYPTEDHGSNPYQWETASFTKGPAHMNGKRALAFVRSRHGSNGEGSDFARSRRQQIVLKAVRDRLLSLGTLSNPKTMLDVWSAISSHVSSNISAWDLVKLLPTATQFSSTNISTRVITDDVNGQLLPGTLEGAFMLFPKKSDWSDIQAIIADPFTTKEEEAKITRPQEPIVVEVLNGTIRTGFAAQVGTTLEAAGYTVAGTRNATHRGFEKTVIYDLTNGAKPIELARLKKLLDANISSTVTTPEKLVTSSTQFLIILGNSTQIPPPYAGNTTP